MGARASIPQVRDQPFLQDGRARQEEDVLAVNGAAALERGPLRRNYVEQSQAGLSSETLADSARFTFKR
jgi:hypothetical protein